MGHVNHNHRCHRKVDLESQAIMITLIGACLMNFIANCTKLYLHKHVRPINNSNSSKGKE